MNRNNNCKKERTSDCEPWNCTTWLLTRPGRNLSFGIINPCHSNPLPLSSSITPSSSLIFSRTPSTAMVQQLREEIIMFSLCLSFPLSHSALSFGFLAQLVTHMVMIPSNHTHHMDLHAQMQHWLMLWFVSSNLGDGLVHSPGGGLSCESVQPLKSVCTTLRKLSALWHPE